MSYTHRTFTRTMMRSRCWLNAFSTTSARSLTHACGCVHIPAGFENNYQHTHSVAFFFFNVCLGDIAIKFCSIQVQCTLQDCVLKCIAIMRHKDNYYGDSNIVMIILLYIFKIFHATHRRSPKLIIGYTIAVILTTSVCYGA